MLTPKRHQPVRGGSPQWAESTPAGELLRGQVFPAAPIGSPLRAWDGSTWRTGTLRRWNGSAWVTGTVRQWNGSAWVPT